LEFLSDLYRYARERKGPHQRLLFLPSESEQSSEKEEIQDVNELDSNLAINTTTIGSNSDDITENDPPLFKRRLRGDDDGSSSGENDETKPLQEEQQIPSEDERPMTLFEVARTAIIFCPIWFAANYTFNKGVSMTSVSSNTVLSSTSSTSQICFVIFIF